MSRLINVITDTTKLGKQMSEWYYADTERQRHGPITVEAVREKFQQGELGMTSLVWREGMAQWQPLSDFADELAVSVAVEPGIDLRADYGFIETASAAAPAYDNTASPYAAPAAPLSGDSTVVNGGEIINAGLWRRFAASIIDSFATAILSYALLIPLMLLFGLSLSTLAQSEFASIGSSIGFMIAQYGISILVPAIYFGWMHSTSSMASLGKLAVGIKVVRTSGERISFWRSFLRYVAFAVFTLATCGLGVLISGLMVAFSQRKQGLHDMICDTLVVDKWAFTDHPEWQQQGLGTVTIVILSIFGVLLLVVGIIGVLAAIGIAASGFK